MNDSSLDSTTENDGMSVVHWIGLCGPVITSAHLTLVVMNAMKPRGRGLVVGLRVEEEVALSQRFR